MSDKKAPENGEQDQAMAPREPRNHHHRAIRLIMNKMRDIENEVLEVIRGNDPRYKNSQLRLDTGFASQEIQELKDSVIFLEQPELPKTVTEEGLKALIDAVEYNRPMVNSSFITCYIRLKNGFVVTGESCPVDPSKFDLNIGSDLAYKKAFEKLWMLEGYLLTVKRHEKYA